MVFVVVIVVTVIVTVTVIVIVVIVIVVIVTVVIVTVIVIRGADMQQAAGVVPRDQVSQHRVSVVDGAPPATIYHQWPANRRPSECHLGAPTSHLRATFKVHWL